MRSSGAGEGPFTYTWSFAICPHRVRIGLPVVEGLQLEMGGGPEPRQGLLYGQRDPGVTEVTEWRALPALDSGLFAASLKGETRDAVGYYLIREGSAFMLSPAEVALAQESFRKQGSVVLLVERRRKGPAEATFYFWRGDVFVHNLPLPFPFHAGILSGETPGLSDVPAAAPPRFGAMSGVRRRILVGGLYAATAIAAGGLVAAHLRSQRLEARRAGIATADMPPEPPTWIATQPKRDLELTWDAHTEPVSTATAGVLKIEDAGGARQMSLDVGELLMGSILYAPVSSRIRVELTTLQRDGRMVPVPVATRPAPPSFEEPVAADIPPAAAPKNHKEPLGEPADLEKAEVVEPLPPRRPALKRFTWTAADRAQPESPVILDAPHPPMPAVNPAVLTAELPAGAIGVPAPPAAPPPRPAPTPVPAAPARTLPRSGRLIWTGTLVRRGVVELDGRTVSVGSINGGLPGAPVNLSVTPAEFGEDGLIVFTTDASRHNRVEPPSAGNGWNKVTFVWAPERVREIAILEAPNPGNAFNRLTLRSDARRCSMILIDWTLRQ